MPFWELSPLGGYGWFSILMVKVFSVTAKSGDMQEFYLLNIITQCLYINIITQCFQLQTLFIWLNSKLLGFSNDKFIFKEWWIFIEKEGKVRDYNFSFEDYLQRFVPKKATAGADLCKLQAVPTGLHWYHSHWPILKCQYAGIDIMSSSYMCLTYYIVCAIASRIITLVSVASRSWRIVLASLQPRSEKRPIQKPPRLILKILKLL